MGVRALGLRGIPFDEPPLRRRVRLVAPGVLAGASDIDPTTVATMAIVGATTAYGLSWLVVLVFPMLAVIQTTSSRVGMVTRCDLQQCVAQIYGRRARLLLLVTILSVTLLTVAADIEAGAAAIGMLVGSDWRIFVAPLALVLVVLLMIGGFDEIQSVLRWLLIGFAAYAVAAFAAHPNWHQVLHSTVVPSFHLDSAWTQGAVAVIGTTITSYVYVWQTIEEAEESAPLRYLRARQAGAITGIGLGVVVFWLILVTSGATLGVHHRTVDTAQQAASALRPIAGPASTYVFAIGLLVSALVALPVLLATTAYVVGAEFDWARGLSRRVRNAPRFYGVLVAAASAGVALALAGVSPIRLLFVSSIVGGLATPVSLVFLMRVAENRRLMGASRISPSVDIAGWLVTIVIAVAGVAFVVGQLLGA